MKEDLRSKRQIRTTDRIRFLKMEGYNVVEMWECEFKKLTYTEPGLDDCDVIPPFTRKYPGKSNMKQIILAVEEDRLFGAVEVDIEVPDNWGKGMERSSSPWEYFQEMSPLFCTTDIGFDDIGSHMQDHVRSYELSMVRYI